MTVREDSPWLTGSGPTTEEAGRTGVETDNQSPTPGRPMTVTPDDMEQALRDCLSRQVSVPPVTADLAGVAVHRANRMHRRRTFAGVTLAAVVTIATSAGMAQFGGSPREPGPAIVVLGDPSGRPDSAVAGPTPSAMVSGAAINVGPPSVDLVVGTDLIVSTGESIDLSALGKVSQAKRVSDGWLVVSSAEPIGKNLWFVPEAGSPKAILTGVDVVVLASDGQRIAWRDKSQISAATVAGGQLSTMVQVGASSDTVPVGFVGVAVLLGRTGDAGLDAYRLWWPSSPTAEHGTWNPAVAAIYGMTSGGNAVVGQLLTGASARPCLALLDPGRNLVPVKTACQPQLDVSAAGTVSPDGRWLLVNGMGGASAGRAVVIDLNSAFGTAPAVRAAGPAISGATVWTDPATAVHVDERGESVRVVADRAVVGAADGVQRFPGPAVVPGDQVVLVTR